MERKGKVYLFGNDVNTDEIIPARFLNTTDLKTLARNCMEDARPGFGQAVEPGSILVAGSNFGCGSSREHAPLAIKHAGISFVIAASFARIFFRNCINIGLPIIESPEVAGAVSEGDILSVDIGDGTVILPSGKKVSVTPFPLFMQSIVESGGLIPFLMKRPKV